MDWAKELYYCFGKGAFEVTGRELTEYFVYRTAQKARDDLQKHESRKVNRGGKAKYIKIPKEIPSSEIRNFIDNYFE